VWIGDGVGFWRGLRLGTVRESGFGLSWIGRVGLGCGSMSVGCVRGDGQRASWCIGVDCWFGFDLGNSAIGKIFSRVG
jgi:hypothetical protein